MKTSFLVSGCVFFAVAAVHGVEGAIYTEVDEMRDLDHARGLQVVTPSPSEMMHDMGTHSPAHTSHGTPSPAMDISESVAPTSTETDGAVVASGVASYTTVLASCAMALVAGAMWAL